MPERPKPFEPSGISSFGGTFLEASSRNGSRVSSSRFPKESPKRRRSGRNRLASSACCGGSAAKIVYAAWPQPLTSCKPSDDTSTHQRVRLHKLKATHGNWENLDCSARGAGQNFVMGNVRVEFQKELLVLGVVDCVLVFRTGEGFDGVP